VPATTSETPLDWAKEKAPESFTVKDCPITGMEDPDTKPSMEPELSSRTSRASEPWPDANVPK